MPGKFLVDLQSKIGRFGHSVRVRGSTGEVPG